MGIEENKAVMREFVERMGKGDSVVIDELMTENVVGYLISNGIQSASGKELREGFKQTNDMGHIAWPDYSMTIEAVIAEGYTVVVRVTRRGTHLGKFYNLIPTNKSVEVGRIYIARLENGKIAELWMMEDHLGMYVQMGVLPTSAEFMKAYNEAHSND